jgi:tRNA 2-thiocytidine biosynthesis protein TtcA
MTPIRRKVDKRITRAVMEYGLISPGDRILVAVSGGKDSLALAWNLALKVRGFPIPFEVGALHVDPGFGGSGRAERLASLLGEWDLDLTVVAPPSDSCGKEGPKEAPNCWRCARERRRVLFEYAAAHGFGKVALGHHMDDSLATLLMNMAWNAELAAMPPIVPAAIGSPAVIRPLVLLQEADLKRLASSEEWPIDSCACPWAGDSRRQAAAAVVAELTGGNPKLALNLWKSLSNIKGDLLPPSGGSQQETGMGQKDA